MSPAQDSLLWRLIDIAKSLSSEKDKWRLLDRILTESQQITHADGGTLYLLKNDGLGVRLEYGIIRNSSLQIAQINRPDSESALMPIPVHDPHSGKPNHQNIATHCTLTRTAVNIEDAYNSNSFDVSGIREFDELFDYRTQSILTLPLQNHDDEVIGVLQLVNATDPHSGDITAFTDHQVDIVQALASLVAITLDNSLMVDDERDLLIRLSREKETDQLFGRILDEALAITRAEGGTLYLYRDNGPKRLEFAVLKNRRLNLNLGGSSGGALDMQPLLLEQNGEPNLQNIATYTALSRQLVNIGDAYDSTAFDFSGMRAFDTTHGYHSQSFLSVPLVSHGGAVIGVLQLVNACDSDGNVTAFSRNAEPIVLALASYGAIALENRMLLEDQARSGALLMPS